MRSTVEIINEICSLYEDISIRNEYSFSLERLKFLLYQVCGEASASNKSSYQDIIGKYSSIKYSDIRPIISVKYLKLGYYHIVLNLSKVFEKPDIALGDSIDDLCDIIIDMSEVKWRIENIGYDDGIGYMRFIFKAHTEDHIIGLISHINEILSL